MKKAVLLIIAVAIFGLLGWLIASRTPAPDTVTEEQSLASRSEPAKLPELSFTDYEGSVVSLSSLRGTPLVVNSWAAWCTFCRKELIDFRDIQKEFGDKVTIVAIDRGERLEVAKKFADELGVSDDLLFLLDPSDSFYRAIDGFSMPETIFADRNGVIRSHKRGIMGPEEIRERIQGIID